MLTITLWCIFLVFSSFTSTNTSSVITDHQGWKYAVIIDAGSTGSRVHVYKYRNPNDPDHTATALVRTDSLSKELMDIDFRNEKYEKFKPGLSSFESYTQIDTLKMEMTEYMKPLLQFARKHTNLESDNESKTTLRKSDEERIPFFVLATAGMRKVREHNSNQADLIMSAVFDVVSQAQDFVTRKEWIRIIEGTDEGLWGWVTANYLNGALQSNGKIPTKGVLEMGGESLQITFTPKVRGLGNSKLQKLNKQVTSVNIAGKEHYIFTHSYMGIGMEAAQLRFDQHLLLKKSNAEKMNIKNVDYSHSPCYLSGSKREYKQDSNDNNDNIEFEGSGHFDECLKELSWILDQTKVCRQSPVSDSREVSKNVQSQSMHNYHELIMRKSQNERCTPNGILMPNILEDIHDFYYIENFYYTANVLNIDNVGGDSFLSELHRKGAEYCSLTKKQAQTKYPNARDDEIEKTCFCAAWLIAMIETGFKLESFNKFRVIRDINSVGIDWALGFLVLNSDEIVQTLQSLREQSSNPLLKYFSSNRDSNVEDGYNVDDSGTIGTENGNDYMSSLLVLILIIAVCVFAFAYYHDFDKQKMYANTQYYYHRLSQGSSTHNKKRETELA